MGHYCRICGRTRANEKFSGKGHKRHVCKDCSGKSGKKAAESEIEELVNPLEDMGLWNPEGIPLEETESEEIYRFEDSWSYAIDPEKIDDDEEYDEIPF